MMLRHKYFSTFFLLGAFLVSSPAFSALTPGVTLNASSSRILSGSSVTLSWSASDATSCTASGAWSGPKAFSGSQDTGVLTTTGLFVLTCSGSGGTTAKSVTVSVGTAPKIFTSISVVNTGAGTAQTKLPLTFGQVFKAGDVAAGTTVKGTLSSGAVIPLQLDIKSTHADGSVRHGVISAVLANLAVGQTETISLYSAKASATTPASPTGLLAAGFTSSVRLTIGAETYTAAAESLLAGPYMQWLGGASANEWIVSAPLLNTISGAAHPHLTARFAVRAYSGNKKAKVDVAIENTRTFTAGAQNFTYDAKVYVGGVEVDSYTALEHYHHARWHKVYWWGTSAPQIALMHNTDYLIATKALPNYDRTVVPTESAIAALVSALTADKTGPMKIGLANPYMPSTGGRIDIGPLPGWYVIYLLSMDPRAKDVMLSIADGSGSWPMHYRDETDANDMPVRIDKVGNDPATNAPYRNLSVHGNLVGSGPLPVPRCVDNSTTLCVTPLTPDSSHQPSLAYLPYLVTGDYFYLEELQFWTAWNFLGTDAFYHEYEKGLLKFIQVRGQAWSLRTLGQAAYITPDSHPLKSYFGTTLSNNFAHYNTVYVTANPNQLGVIDGTETNEYKPIAYDTLQGIKTGIAPWQDDFFTWSMGYLTELAYADAQPILVWKSKFPVGRMTDPGYCWIVGAVYSLAVRATETSPVYGSFAESYAATVQTLTATDGTKFIDSACASQAQADWLSHSVNTVFATGTYKAGEMTGYSSSATGYPSNMQPALAVAVASGIANAQAAWDIFNSRTVKPDYSAQPQFAIVPR